MREGFNFVIDFIGKMEVVVFSVKKIGNLLIIVERCRLGDIGNI